MWALIAGPMILALAGTASAQSDARQICDEMEVGIASLGLPVDIDQFSQLVSRSTLYIQGRCVIRDVVTIDTERLLDSITAERNSRGIGTHRDSVTETALSKSGREAIIAEVRKDVEQGNQDILSVPGVTLYVTYETSDPVPPFTVTLESGSQ